MEKTNFRYLDPQAIAEKADIAVMDVSFISVLKLSDNLRNFLKEDGRLVILIKPQFEAEKGQVSKGVITDKNMHAAIVGKVIDGMAEKKYALQNLTYSPIKGPKGNIEFLAEFSPAGILPAVMDGKIIKECVEEAHRSLK
jgi:23S rRNA (cytidine1920-2'-O)/16S rRNA (cytidine1409-2'-O)-methyltransferase